MLVHFKKAFSLTSLGTHLKEELTAHLLLCFESLSRQRMLNTLLMININLICKRYIRDVYSFLFMSGKNQKPGLYLQQAGNKLLNTKYVFS